MIKVRPQRGMNTSESRQDSRFKIQELAVLSKTLFTHLTDWLFLNLFLIQIFLIQILLSHDLIWHASGAR